MMREGTLRVVGNDNDVLSITELFHRINRLLPEDQDVITVSPDTPASEAISKMQQHGFSQVPVVENDEVLGIFSYRSFTKEVLELDCKRNHPGKVPVEDCMQIVGPSDFVNIKDEFQAVFQQLDANDTVLVGMPNRLQGIVTPMDLLWYLYGVAHPFVLLAEIELGVRALLRLAVDEEMLIDCIKNALAKHYPPDRLPKSLEEMTFNDYIQVVTHGDNWNNHFKSVFGGMREKVRTRLERSRDLRNDLFHFRRTIALVEHEELAGYRDWVLMRSRRAEAKSRGEACNA